MGQLITSKYGTIYIGIGGMSMIRLPKKLADTLNLKHGEKVRITASNNNNKIVITRLGRGKKI